MSYCESGKNVMTLFHNRGWEAIIADDLVGNTLLLVSVIVGGLTGSIAIIIELSSGWLEEDNPGNEKGDNEHKRMTAGANDKVSNPLTG